MSLIFIQWVDDIHNGLTRWMLPPMTGFSVFRHFRHALAKERVVGLHWMFAKQRALPPSRSSELSVRKHE
jgi:hypothetical protein